MKTVPPRIGGSMEKSNRNCLMWLNHIKTFRQKDRTVLLKIYGDAVSVYEALKPGGEEVDRLVERKIIKPSTVNEIMNDSEDRWFDKLTVDLESKYIKALTLDDPDYPDRLKYIPTAPLVLYMRGKTEFLNYEHGLGIVGSRRPTYYGNLVADEFTKALAVKGITIISGMAMGIDARCHQAALESNGKTIAVLGGGVDICYPQTNYDIYMEMCEKALLVSEYEPGEAHISLHFPSRNRIISGLSDGILVIEAMLRSGTMITVDNALEQNKEIYAVPGRVTDMLSKGTNNIIKQGAALVDSPADIIVNMLGTEAFYKNDDKKVRGSGVNSTIIKKDKLSEKQTKLLGMLGFEPVFIDDLIRANDMNISDTIHNMKALEELGYVRSIEQSYYILSGKNTCI